MYVCPQDNNDEAGGDVADPMPPRTGEETDDAAEEPEDIEESDHEDLLETSEAESSSFVDRSPDVAASDPDTDFEARSVQGFGLRAQDVGDRL